MPESAQRFRTGQSICQFQFRSIRVFQLNRTNEILKLLYQNKKRFFKNLAPTLIISKIYCSLSLFSTQSLLQTSLLFLSLPVILFTLYGSHHHIPICCSLSAFFLSLPVIPKRPSTYLPYLICLCIHLPMYLFLCNVDISNSIHVYFFTCLSVSRRQHRKFWFIGSGKTENFNWFSVWNSFGNRYRKRNKSLCLKCCL